MRYLIYLILLVLFFAGCQEDNSIDKEIDNNSSTEHPNILLIIADDMGLDACPGYAEGEQKPAMPNLDALAADGITFENA